MLIGKLILIIITLKGRHLGKGEPSMKDCSIRKTQHLEFWSAVLKTESKC